MICVHTTRQIYIYIFFHNETGLFFWDYGNAFLLEARRAGADVGAADNEGSSSALEFKYPSYVQDIMGYTA